MLVTMDRVARKEMLNRYAPIGSKGTANHVRCCCQWCMKSKRVDYVNVNDVLRKPDVHFKQLKLVLCLECSKSFELLRNDNVFYRLFIDGLKRLNPDNDQDNVCIKWSNFDFQLTFTRTHLAEVQGILNGMDSAKKDRDGNCML